MCLIEVVQLLLALEILHPELCEEESFSGFSGSSVDFVGVMTSP